MKISYSFLSKWFFSRWFGLENIYEVWGNGLLFILEKAVQWLQIYTVWKVLIEITVFQELKKFF